MARLLFKLNNVPDDEADDVRALIDESEIDYYETTEGSWGLSFAAIWLQYEAQMDKARELIDAYQAQRQHQAIQLQQALVEAGEHTTHWQAFKRSPVRVIAVIILVSVILYFSIMPFFPA